MTEKKKVLILKKISNPTCLKGNMPTVMPPLVTVPS